MSLYRSKIENWKDTNFSNEFNRLFGDSSNLSVSVTREIIFGENYMNLDGEVISGWMTEGLPKSEEIGSYKISFSELFHEIQKSNDFGPVLYIHNLINKIIQNDEAESKELTKIFGFVARSMRTFASLVREQALLEQLKWYFERDNHFAEFLMSPKQDKQDKTDILILFNNKKFRLWTYQHTSRGLPHNIERISGARGSLPAGIHVLCPLISSSVDDLSKIFKKIKTQNKKIKTYSEKIQQLQEKDLSKLNKLKLDISICEEKLVDLDNEYKKVESDASLYVEEVNGYFLYSDNCAENIYKTILNFSDVKSYEEVKEILLAPEKLLAVNTVFEVIN